MLNWIAPNFIQVKGERFLTANAENNEPYYVHKATNVQDQV